MHEVVLREFFEGRATAQELARDLAGTAPVGAGRTYRSSADYAVAPMQGEFVVRAAHLTALVGAGLDGGLSPTDLNTVAFCLDASDRFVWDGDSPDGERVAEAVFLLGAPEVNWPLTPSVLAAIHGYLLTGHNSLAGLGS